MDTRKDGTVRIWMQRGRPLCLTASLLQFWSIEHNCGETMKPEFLLCTSKKAGEPYSVSFDEPGYNSVTGNSKFYADYSLAYIPNGADDTNVVFSSASVASDVMGPTSTVLHWQNTRAPTHQGMHLPILIMTDWMFVLPKKFQHFVTINSSSILTF